MTNLKKLSLSAFACYRKGLPAELAAAIPGLALVGALAFSSIALAQISWLVIHGIGPLTLAILLGITFGNTAYTRLASKEPIRRGHLQTNIAACRDRSLRLACDLPGYGPRGSCRHRNRCADRRFDVLHRLLGRDSMAGFRLYDCDAHRCRQFDLVEPPR